MPVTDRQLAEAVIDRLRAAGHEALLAGGCVRDLLLGRSPKDYDVATSARPEEVLALWPRALTVGAAFGVVIVLEDGCEVEVATFRRDAAYTDGRRPDAVTFTDARQDALRRDFTINGMFLDPRSGDVVDYVGGRADIEARVIRAIGDPGARLAEDYLRMLRAVRFAAELGFDIDPPTAEAVRAVAPKIAQVSGERVREEMARILTAPSSAGTVPAASPEEGDRHAEQPASPSPSGRRRGLELASDLGLLAVLLPEVESLKGVEQGPTVHPEGDVFTHTLLAVETLREPTFELSLAALLHDLGKRPTFMRREGKITFYGHERIGEEMARVVCVRLRLSALATHRVAWLVRQHMKLMYFDEMRVARLKRLMAEDGFEELAELWRADCLASGGTAEGHEALMARYRALSREEVRPKPLVTGGDLIALGLVPGPKFREILEAVYDAQLEGRAASKDEAMALARRLGLGV